MTNERYSNGNFNSQRENRQPNRRPSAQPVRRVYPGADDMTSQFVAKLRTRSAADRQSQNNRATSSALMQDVYKTVPARHSESANAKGERRAPAANVSAAPEVRDNRYSPYSNVNVNAENAAKRREAQNRTAPQPQARANVAATRPVQQKQQVASARRQGSAPRVHTGAKNAPAPVEVKFRGFDTSGQMAESGPREVAFKRVPFPKFIVIILMLALVFFLMVHSIMKNFEYQQQIDMLESQLSELNDRAEELRLELEERDDLAEIERLAEEIGMIKNAGVDEKYISLDNSDIIENFVSEENDYGTFTTMLSAVSRQLSRFLGDE